MDLKIRTTSHVSKDPIRKVDTSNVNISNEPIDARHSMWFFTKNPSPLARKIIPRVARKGVLYKIRLSNCYSGRWRQTYVSSKKRGKMSLVPLSIDTCQRRVNGGKIIL